jgi:hypothetical protein
MVSSLIPSNGLQTASWPYVTNGFSDLFLRKTSDFVIIAPPFLPYK